MELLDNSFFEDGNNWAGFIKNQLNQDYFRELATFLNLEFKNKTIFPTFNNIFSALESTSFDNVKVVIIGQDPYHSFELLDDSILPHAHGLSFSVPKQSKKIPPSLKNIFKEINNDLGFDIPKNGNLISWAKQGVLLLNATLTVEKHLAGSHQNKGWEEFTDELIRYVSKNKEGIVFLLWGKYAQNKAGIINSSKHFLLETSHPSPFSARRGFLGCQHFSKTNELLKNQGKQEIDWQIK